MKSFNHRRPEKASEREPRERESISQPPPSRRAGSIRPKGGRVTLAPVIAWSLD